MAYAAGLREGLAERKLAGEDAIEQHGKVLELVVTDLECEGHTAP